MGRIEIPLICTFGNALLLLLLTCTRRSLLGPNSAHLVSSEREILGIEPGQSVNVPRCTVAAVLKQTCGSLGPNRDLETLSPLTYYNK